MKRSGQSELALGPAVLIVLGCLGSLPAHAQTAGQTSSQTNVLVSAGFRTPPPSITLASRRDFSFGFLTTPHSGRGNCSYTVGPDGTRTVGARTTTGASAAVAGCAFISSTSEPGSISGTCVGGGRIAITTQIDGLAGPDGLNLGVLTFLLREAEGDNGKALASSPSFECPPNGQFLLDIGGTLTVPNSVGGFDASISTARRRILLTANIS